MFSKEGDAKAYLSFDPTFTLVENNCDQPMPLSEKKACLSSWWQMMLSQPAVWSKLNW